MTRTTRNRFTAELRSELASHLSRSTPGEINTREAVLAPKSIKGDARQVRVIATTEEPAMVWDWRSGVILEVLLMSGAEFEDQTPLLRDHIQYSITAICGSFTEPKVVGKQLEGLITVGKDLDDTVEGIWKRIEQGHLRRVSIGYDYTTADYVTIAPGETAIVEGRTFTAPKDRPLRVVKRWRLRELSLVVIPADARAQMKAQESERRGTDGAENPNSHSASSQSTQDTRSDEVGMKRFLQFLHKHGLAASVTNETEALTWARSGNLSAELITELDRLCKEDGIDFDPAAATPRRSEPSTTGTRSGTGTGAGNTDTENHGGSRSGSAETLDPATAASQAIAEERQRVAAIRQLASEHDIAREVADRACDEGLTLDQTRDVFLQALRSSRQEGAPAVHVRNGLSGAEGVRTLQAALLARNGINPDSAVLRAEPTTTLARRRDLAIDWAIGCASQGERRNQLEAAFERVHQRGLAGASMMRLAQELIEMESGQRAPYSPDEVIERAFSSANFSAVFGATVHMMLWDGYVSTPDTYSAFCEVVDVPDFKDNSQAMYGEVGRLKRQGKTPGQAPLLNMTDPTLASLAADRYAGMLKITEQSFINDSFGILGQTPFKLGQATRAMIADRVFSELLSTANLSDGRARFNATDANLITGGTADVAGFGAAEKKLRAVKVGDRRISLGRTQVVTGLTLGPTFRTLRSESKKVDEDNPFAGTFDLVEDTAIDIGVTDPYTDPETTIAGRPNSYFLLAKGGSSIVVAFRSGTGRGPVTRRKVLDGGEWGMLWDVYVDMGAAFLRRTGAVEVQL